MTYYKDIHQKSENDRITEIGVAATLRPGKTIAFFTDLVGDDGYAKADRYIAKLLAKFPHLQIVDKFHGPTPGVVSVIVTYPENTNEPGRTDRVPSPDL